MNEQLLKRFALAMLGAMTVALAMGLQAWGPMQLSPAMHRFADERSWLGLPHAFNTLASLPLLVMGAWGWRATGASRWPAPLRAAWRGFHAFMVPSALLSAAYHLTPNNTLFTLARTGTVCAVALLTCALLGERVAPRFVSPAVRTGACVAVGAVGIALWLGERVVGSIDVRPLMLLEVVPLLLIPAGVVHLPGAQTRPLDWMMLLSSYAASKLFELGDAAIFNATGWISGHSLMHLALAFATGWMAHRAGMVAGAAEDSPSTASSQRETSLNTSSLDAM